MTVLCVVATLWALHRRHRRLEAQRRAERRRRRSEKGGQGGGGLGGRAGGQVHVAWALQQALLLREALLACFTLHPPR